MTCRWVRHSVARGLFIGRHGHRVIVGLTCLVMMVSGCGRRNAALLAAVKSDDVSAVKQLVAAGASVNRCDGDVNYPLHYCRSKDMAIALLDAGALVDVRNDFNDTPLHVAASSGCEPVAEVLLQHGADVRATNRLGETPLYLAVTTEQVEDVAVKSRFWDEKGKVEVARLLIAHGSDVNARDEFGGTPLEQAALLRDCPVATMLLDAGADINARDLDGKTPLFRARQARSMFGGQEMITLLESRGGRE